MNCKIQHFTICLESILHYTQGRSGLYWTRLTSILTELNIPSNKHNLTERQVLEQFNYLLSTYTIQSNDELKLIFEIYGLYSYLIHSVHECTNGYDLVNKDGSISHLCRDCGTLLSWK
jgi:hypothetical protein